MPILEAEKMNKHYWYAKQALLSAGWNGLNKAEIITTKCGASYIRQLAENELDDDRTLTMLAATGIMTHDAAVEVCVWLSEHGYEPFIIIFQFSSGLQLVRSMGVTDLQIDYISSLVKVGQTFLEEK